MAQKPPSRSSSFRESLGRFESYPKTLVSTSKFPRSQRSLNEFWEHLQTLHGCIFVDPSINHLEAVEFYFRDYQPRERNFKRWRVNKESMLQDHLQLPSNAAEPLTKPDPPCRFIFIHAENSREKLKITRNMMSTLLTYHQVMPSFLDLIFPFGEQYEPRDQHYSRFTFENFLGNRGEQIDFLNRSGNFYQMCYNLKAVEKISREEKYRVRQAAIYHSFDSEKGSTVWMTVKGNRYFKELVESLTDKEAPLENKSFDTVSASFRSSLSIHEAFAEWATSNWRWYINLWEEKLRSETAEALHVAGTKTLPMLANDIPADDESYFTFKKLQNVQFIEDNLNEIAWTLKANKAIIRDMKKAYKAIMDHPDFSQDAKTNCRDSYQGFTSQLSNVENEFESFVESANLVLRLCTDRKAHLQAVIQNQNATRMHLMTVSMQRITNKTNKETIIMRVITLVALVFLPGTFVSSFFSTDVVHYDEFNKRKYSSKALEVWLIVTFVMLAITAALAGFVYWRSMRKLKKDEETLLRGSE